MFSTFTPEQRVMFENLIENMNKLHKLDIEEYIVHTHKVCKDLFKLNSGSLYKDLDNKKGQLRNLEIDRIIEITYKACKELIIFT